MDPSLFSLVLVNFGFIGILPRIFFRSDGRFNLRWWLTALPFLIGSSTLIAGFFGYLNPVSYSVDVWIPRVAVIAFSLASIVLMAFTLGTHRIPLALWHQQNDKPREIVTWGAYKKIRHPFYASFLLCSMASVILFPHALTLIGLVYAYFILNFTAANEEKKLSQSDYGNQYIEYMKVTGRFFPRIGK